MGRPYTADEDEFIRENMNILNNRDMALEMGRTLYSVRDRQRRLGLKRPRSVSRRMQGKAQYGEQNPNWKGGISENHYHYKKLQVARYPERIKAREAVKNALKSGILEKECCCVCRDDETEAHHKDYSKPLDVDWMCTECHDILHTLERK
jgi:hypothetical protein